MKQAKGKILGYGFIRKGTKAYRNALRYCRKTKRIYGVGFDYSELWNLDCTFLDFAYCKKYINVKLSDKLFDYSFKDYNKLGYQIEVLKLIEFKTYEECHDKEVKLKRLIRNYTYCPKN